MEEILASIREIVADGAKEETAPEPVAPAMAAAIEEVLPRLAGTVTANGETLDGVVRAMLEPLLKTWLDAHLPEIVEQVTTAEIRRLTGRG